MCLLTEGWLDVSKDGLKLLTIEPEDMFGELALLYNCTHTYSVSGIKALSSWFLYLHAYIAGDMSHCTEKYWWSFTLINFDLVGI